MFYSGAYACLYQGRVGGEVASIPNSLAESLFFGILKSAGLRPEEEWLLRSVSQRRTIRQYNVGAEKGEIYSKVCKVLAVT